MANEKKSKGDAKKFPISTMRHSAAHVMAQAIAEKYPDAQFAIGPEVDNGFYYDVITEPAIAAEDLADIEKRMRRIVKARQPFERFHLPYDEALQYLRACGQTFKEEMARDFHEKAGLQELSFYKNIQARKADGEESAFVDMCDGPHVDHTGQIGAFKLSSVAGAYWRGDSNRAMLTRIYGWLFETEEELKAYGKMIEEARKRDHRRLGQDLELFTTSEKIGPGMILWLPRGNIVKEELERWAKDTEEASGYQRVTTPVLTKEELFYTSEHLPHYKEHMFPAMELDNTRYYIKPMNCPFHHTIFADRPRSYRELPLRLAEYGLCHRYEDSGSLFGTMRVRAMWMNDAHIYCTEDQAVAEFKKVIELHEHFYKQLGIHEYYMVLSLRNPANNKYHGEEQMWAKAEALTRQAMEESGVKFTVEQDGAAFYGPKMDFQIKSSIGREFTASTCQLDLFMPMKFELRYVDRDGQLKQPVCIHRSPLGTHERFIGFLIEHFAGAFPLWLAPEQVRILPVGENYSEYAHTLADALRKNRIRVQVDDSGETLGKRIRNAEKMKINYMLVAGEKEQSAGVLNARNYFSGQQQEYDLDAFIRLLRAEIDGKEIQRRTKDKQD
ncbi:MAG: threonine--tRNA ligase [Leptospirales bacterium]|nr:threonine--tRNA ligase [Leptospirales bacterium]